MGHRTCSVDGCKRPHSGRGYCAVHYQHWHRYGDPLHYAPPAPKICSFPGCGGKVDSHGLCSAHAAQFRKGQELKPLRPFWNGASCTVDGCKSPIVARGYCHKHWAAWREHGDPLGHAVHRRRRSGTLPLDEGYFDEIVTEEQAYWLGFLTADGAIIQSGTKSYSLRVELAERDEAHLNLLSVALGVPSKIPRKRPARGSVIVYYDSWRLIEALGRLGITPRKSATAEPWDGPTHLMRHYWRGLFDGDGCISKTGRDRTWSTSLAGSEACVKAFARWAHLVCGSVAKPHHVKGGCWSWATAGTEMPQLLAVALYGEATVALLRKKERANTLAVIDFQALRQAGNAQRAATMRDAWSSGRHPRSTVLPE